MPNQRLTPHDLVPRGRCSKYSAPRREHPDGSYEIHLVKADSPHYIPGDIEIWPVYHTAILDAIQTFPEAAAAAFAAYTKVREEYAGRRNRDLPKSYK
jgi:hypothetical protein